MFNSHFFKFVFGFFSIIALSGLVMFVVIPFLDDSSSVHVDEGDLTAESTDEVCDATLEVC